MSYQFASAFEVSGKIEPGIYFTVVHGAKTRDSGRKLKQEKFRMDMRKVFSQLGQSSEETGCPERL